MSIVFVCDWAPHSVLAGAPVQSPPAAVKQYGNEKIPAGWSTSRDATGRVLHWCPDCTFRRRKEASA